jgi:hypothetical protein
MIGMGEVGADAPKEDMCVTTSSSESCVDPNPLISAPPSLLTADNATQTNFPPSSEVWHSHDQIFGFPRSVFVSQFKSPAAQDGHPVNSIITNLFTQLTARKYFQVGQTGLVYNVNVGVEGKIIL